MTVRSMKIQPLIEVNKLTSDSVVNSNDLTTQEIHADTTSDTNSFQNQHLTSVSGIQLSNTSESLVIPNTIRTHENSKDTSNCSTDNDSDFSPSSYHQDSYKPKSSESITFDKTVIEKTHRAALGMNVSTRKVTQLLTEIVVAGGGDPEKHSLSYAYGFKVKNKILTEDYDALVALLQNKIQAGNEKIQIKFDGKIMQVILLFK